MVLLILATALPTRGEYFRHLTLSDGLSQPSVMAITQDKLGRMWLGTREGLNVYDGTGITSYKGWITIDEGNRIWIGNEVSSIVCDSIGNIFALIDGNIVKYDLAYERFSRLTDTGNVSALSANDGEVAYMVHDSVFVKSLRNDSIRLACTIPSAKHVTHLAADRHNYYASTGDGLIVHDRQTGSDRMLLQGMNVYASFVSRDGTLWITTLAHGLFRYRHEDQEAWPVSMPTPPEGVIGASQCRHAMEDHRGRIWYGSFSGLFCYNPTTGSTRHIKIPKNIGGLTHPSVFGMYCDRKGNLWIGTYYGGVNYFSPDNDRFLNFNYDDFIPKHLSHSFVKDMVMDRDGRLWFATDGAGVGCLDREWNIVTHLFTHDTGESLRQNNIRCLAYDSVGNRLFIGTHLGGLSVYDISRRVVTNLIDVPQYKKVPGDVIHKLKTHGSYLFIASRSGLSYMDLASGSIRKIDTDLAPSIFDIDREGNIYCTSGHRVYRIGNPTSETATKTVIANLDRKILPTQLCTTDNGLLIATLGNGILYCPYNVSAEEYLNTTNSRLPDDYCYAISRGAENYVYVTTERHVARLDIGNRAIQSIDFSDFFPESHIINECALLGLADGDILVGSTKGITRLNGNSFSTSALTHDSPGIYFSRLRLQNKVVAAGDDTGAIGKALPYSDHIVLPPGNNGFSITIGVSDYLATTGVPTIEYRMDGIDSNWLPASGNELIYKNLPSGSYCLYARYANGKEISIGITVGTPWYNSWWAWLVYCTTTVAIGSFLVQKTLVATRLRRSLQKEKMERAQIEKLNQEKFVFFTNVSHEFQTPLTLIISHVDILMSRYGRHPKLMEGLMRVRTHSEQMSHLVTQLLEFRKLQQNQQVLRIGMHDAYEMLRETATPFCDYASKRGIDFSITACDANPRCACDPSLLDRVLVNLLSNAFKYTPDGGRISCTVNSTAQGNVAFEVEDNGHGIAEKDLPYIFDRFYNGSSDELQRRNDVDYHSTGIGLAFAKSIVDKHHGNISVKSSEGVGTVFRVVIPGTTDAFANDANIVFDSQPQSETGSRPVAPCPSDTTQEVLPMTTDNENACTDMKEQQTDNKQLLLIVEDNIELRNNLAEFFTPYFRIAQAGDGEEGLQKARELIPDIIISDVMMPRMSGTDMCRTIKAELELCHIPVILLTALSASESRLEGFNTNADDYVTKPFESSLLLARVDNLLRLRRILRRQFEKQPVNEVDMSHVNPLDRRLLKSTTEAIERNLANPDFDIPMLCREVGVSRSLFFNKFKSLTGMTPNAFILDYRLKHAASLLVTHPHLSVTDISDMTGFATSVYFSRCFKKQFGVSPLSYRRGSAEPDSRQ